ncbi:MAG TPA: hypothetical protein VHJ17_05855, partial [Thermomonospora sp.]|nr:hypothetical protein [Thermomonospora sp.]
MARGAGERLGAGTIGGSRGTRKPRRERAWRGGLLVCVARGTGGRSGGEWAWRGGLLVRVARGTG